MSVVQSREVRARHRRAAAPRSDLELEREGHQMSVHMVEAKIKRESVTDVQAAAEKMFAAINAAQPEGIRYASSLLPDGETFVALLQVDDRVDNPLPGFPEFREFLEGVEASRAKLANVQPLTERRVSAMSLGATRTTRSP